ncbi:hypothetical protein ES703_120257 [subsurface metagenome]
MEEQGAEQEWKCPPHWWIVDSYNVGRCKYCPAVKDFGKELARYFAKHKPPPWCGDIRERRAGRPRKHEQITRETLGV